MQATTTTSFPDLGLSQEVADALAAVGITEPFPIQRLVIPDALAGRDVLGKSRTGSGKTLAFALPIVERLEPDGARPAALILTPTRELAVQITEDLAAVAPARGLAVAAAYGGISIREQSRAVARAHILVATPGRLDDLARRRLVSLGQVRILVLDEADRMLDMGFLPQVDGIVKRLPADRQTMFFSATLDGQVGWIARTYTRDPVAREVAAPRETVDELTHRFLPVEAGRKAEALAGFLESEADRGPTLVFVRTKRGADRLAEKLKRQGIAAASMHGDMTQAARERALSRFDSGRVGVLIATDVAARGLDLERVTHVVNFDPPDDDKGYVHRVGRTARAGRTGTTITFVAPDQRGDVSRMADRLDLTEEFTSAGMSIAPPRLVYKARRGRNSLLGRRPRRRF